MFYGYDEDRHIGRWRTRAEGFIVLTVTVPPPIKKPVPLHYSTFGLFPGFEQ